MRLISCARQLQSPCSSPSLCEPAPERFAVARLEFGVAGDVDLLELEVLVAAHLGQLSSRALAEMAVGGVVEGDPDYG